MAPAESLLHWRPTGGFTSKAGVGKPYLGWHPVCHSLHGSQGLPPESVTNDTLENSVCFKRPVCYGWMPIHGMSEHRPSVAISVVLALGPTQGNVVHAWFKSLLVTGLVSGPVPLPVCAFVLFGLC